MERTTTKTTISNLPPNISKDILKELPKYFKINLQNNSISIISRRIKYISEFFDGCVFEITNMTIIGKDFSDSFDNLGIYFVIGGSTSRNMFYRTDSKINTLETSKNKMILERFQSEYLINPKVPLLLGTFNVLKFNSRVKTMITISRRSFISLGTRFFFRGCVSPNFYPTNVAETECFIKSY